MACCHAIRRYGGRISTRETEMKRWRARFSDTVHGRFVSREGLSSPPIRALAGQATALKSTITSRPIFPIHATTRVHPRIDRQPALHSDCRRTPREPPDRGQDGLDLTDKGHQVDTSRTEKADITQIRVVDRGCPFSRPVRLSTPERRFRSPPSPSRPPLDTGRGCLV